MITIRHEICGYCGACVAVCPQGALQLIDTYLKHDTESCKNKCRICSKLCPLGAIVYTDAPKPVFTVE